MTRISLQMIMVLSATLVAAGCSTGSPAQSAGPSLSAPAIESSATSPAAAPSAQAAATALCQAAQHNRYVIGVSARSRPPIQLRARPAQLVCGGPDDSSYVSSNSIEELILTSKVKVRVLVFDRSGPTDRVLDPSNLGAWLRNDQSGRIFLVRGNRTAVTALTEMYHP